MAQRDVLESGYALAYWYRNLLSSAGESRRWLVAEIVTRHSEQLMAGLLPGVEKFAGRLVEAEAKAVAAIEAVAPAKAAATDGLNDLCKEHFQIDLSDSKERLKAVREHNAFVSSKRPSGWHLTTGHVFTIGQDPWVCLSPACDTVPTQLSPAKLDSFGERLPFMAVKLFPVEKPFKDVQSNRYLFLKIEGVVKEFCFNNPTNPTSAPIWHTLFADRLGAFGPGFSFGVFMAGRGARGMLQRRYSATVVAQLRYEYALNLVQRLGSTLTRIGLNFA